MVGPPRPHDDATRDHVVVLRNITWAQYVALSDARGSSGPKLTYLDGVLEVMTKGPTHEGIKGFIRRLFEMYAVERDVEVTSLGETTWQDEVKRIGVEADECYVLDADSDCPDIAIEVVITSGGIDKLEVYRRLGVREVWFWIDNRFWLYTLVNGAYRRIRASQIAPGFDFDEIAEIILTTAQGTQTAAVKAYRDSLHRQ